MSIQDNSTKYETRQFRQSLLTGNDVAEILSISRTHAYKLIRDGVIPSIALGRCVRVRPEDLEAFIANNVSSNDTFPLLFSHSPPAQEGVDRGKND